MCFSGSAWIQRAQPHPLSLTVPSAGPSLEMLHALDREVEPWFQKLPEHVRVPGAQPSPPVLYTLPGPSELLGWEQSFPSLPLVTENTKNLGKKETGELRAGSWHISPCPRVYPEPRGAVAALPQPSCPRYLCPGRAQKWPGCHRWWCSSSGGPGTGAGTPGCPA